MDLKKYPQYRALQERLKQGWSTCNVYSILSHVRLRDGLALNVALKEYRDGKYLKNTLIGRRGSGEEDVTPGLHAYDHSYTEATVKWQDIEFSVESAVDGEDILLLVTPKQTQLLPAMLVLETGYLFNMPGYVLHTGETLTAHSPLGETVIRTTGRTAGRDANIPVQNAYFACEFSEAVAFYTGRTRTAAEIRALLDQNRAALIDSFARRGENASVYEAIQCAVAWDTTYDGLRDRIASPVSRLWSIGSGGFVLFCWDNYFCSFMASLESKDLAYANVIEITREHTARGLVPNVYWGTGFASEDRSQPPVGSAMLVEIYRRYGEKWIVEMLYPALQKWNEWYFTHRRNEETGALCWGSDPYEGKRGNYWETAGVNDTYGGALESGLDNSPMYDDVPFDTEKHIMKLEDVGLTGLFILDCRSMIRLAKLLGKEEDAKVFEQRLEIVRKGLDNLWDEDFGCYCNRRTDTGEFSHRVSPTLLYALFDPEVPAARARRMADEHYYNPEELYGEWMIPTIARNDPAYPEQNYWRGRCWPSTNFLAYSAIRSHGTLPDVQKDLAEHSVKLMMKEWTEHRHIHENYSADTGEGCDVPNSDKFYHWGALLGLIGMLESGEVPDYLAEI